MYVCVRVCMACAYMWCGAPHILRQFPTQAPTPRNKETIMHPPTHTHPHTINEIKPPCHPTHTHTPPSHTYPHSPA